MSDTERHYQRASNHNKESTTKCRKGLKGIIKEHQITTAAAASTICSVLKGIIKEHQITTQYRLLEINID